MDYGSKYTDEKIAKVQRKLEAEYKTAQKEVQAKMDAYTKRYAAKQKIMEQKLNDGKITQKQYSDWVNGQIFQGKQWQSQLDHIADVLANSNKVALDIINKECFSTFAENANWQNYLFESGQGINFGFGLYDSHAVANLIKNNPRVLPAKKLDPVKDKAWNIKKIRSSITQSIIQGESLDKLAKRLARVTGSQNMNAMMTHARTALTGAQNAGRYQSLMDAKQMNINVVKEWMATLDYRTRDSHKELDGEQQKVGDMWHPFKFSNGCRFPGDPEGPPREVYNCRCTLVGDLVDYPAAYKRYDNIDGKPIDNMTYKEWYEAKKQKTPTVMDMVIRDKNKYTDVTYRALKQYADDGTFPKGTSAYQKQKVKKIIDDYDSQVVKAPTVNPATAPRTANYIDNVTDVGFNNKPGVRNYVDNLYADRIAKDLGVSKAEAIKRVEDGIKRIIDESDFTMRIRKTNLMKSLEGGYFKNQHEPGISSGGMYNPAARKRLENKMFNVPMDGIDDADRPIYGMFSPKFDPNNSRIVEYYENGPGHWYGDGVTVVLKKDNVINNATMTLGDSLVYGDELVGTEVNNIKYAGDHSNGIETSKLGKINKSTSKDKVNKIMMDFSHDDESYSDSYFEWQLHKKEAHSVKNIDYVIINHDTYSMNQDLIQKLDEMGIPWRLTR